MSLFALLASFALATEPEIACPIDDITAAYVRGIDKKLRPKGKEESVSQSYTVGQVKIHVIATASATRLDMYILPPELEPPKNQPVGCAPMEPEKLPERMDGQTHIYVLVRWNDGNPATTSGDQWLAYEGRREDNKDMHPMSCGLQQNMVERMLDTVFLGK